MSRASTSFSGGSADRVVGESPRRPCRPARTGSPGRTPDRWRRPAISSCAAARRAIRCTVKPLERAHPAAASRRCAASPAPLRRTASAVSRSSATPPTSDLCVMSGERILSATGKPRASRAATAASMSAATRVGYHRNAEGGEHGLGLGFGEHAASVGQRLPDDPLGDVALDRSRRSRPPPAPASATSWLRR